MSDDWKIRFGTAGTSDSFAAQGYKTSLEVPEYTAKMGLNAFEYQCGRGVRLGLDKAAKMAALAAPKDILFSVQRAWILLLSSSVSTCPLAMMRGWNLFFLGLSGDTGFSYQSNNIAIVPFFY